MASRCHGDAVTTPVPDDAIQPETRADLRAWLAQHHAQSDSVWLILWKRASGRRQIGYDDLVEEALCFGWIDSLPRKLDGERSMIRLSPRKRGSAWSLVNRQRVEKLIAAGLMTKAGLRKVEQARADGTWHALDAVEALALPDDLVAALAAYPQAHAHFTDFPRSSKRLILEWIASARRPETRAARVAETARLAQANVRANHYRQPVRTRSTQPPAATEPT